MKISEINFAFRRDSEKGVLGHHCLGIAVAFLLLLLSYSNSFQASWHLDDYDNITDNAGIQIRQWDRDGIKKVSLGITNSGLLSRPVSYLSFALNHYWGGSNVFGYHAFNFAIHFLAFVFLFLFILHTLKLPLMARRYEKHAYTIALLSALLWAVNPLQVSAVTYIVQRMSSLAALFYIMSMFFYVRFRTAESRLRSGFYVAACLFCAVLSIGSKENAVMLPLSILLYDLFFIQGLTRDHLRRSIKFIAVPLLAILLAVWLFYDFSADLQDYQRRPFTMKERLLTEPRVVLYYLSLLFYPLTDRLTMIHDIRISRGLFDPWTTAAAIAAITAAITAALLRAKKNPLFAYSVLFFFLNHAVEGSFLSLEIVFEHRNYLPSMLLFVPAAVGFVRLLEHFSQKKAVFCTMAVSMSLILMTLGAAVHVRNDIMKDEISLWSDNVEKSPRLHHPRQWLGASLMNTGRLFEARDQLMIASELYEAGHVTKKGLTYALIGECHWRAGSDDTALAYFRKSVNFYPPYTNIPISYDRMARIYLKRCLPDAADESARKAVALRPGEADFRLTRAAVLLKKREPKEAIRELQKALRLNPDMRLTYHYLADAFALKNNPAAERHFRSLSRAGLAGT